MNMNPNIAASGGNAMARLGRQLAQTGQDVSAMMEATAKADDETKLMRMKQRWKEAHNKQIIFQEENPNEPLDWQTHRAKMLPNIEAENNATKFNTQWGRKNGAMAYEMWKSNTGMEVDRMSHGKIFRNRIDVGLTSIKDSLENFDMVGAQQTFEMIKGDLHPSVAEGVAQNIEDKGEEYIWNDGVDEVRADPSGYLKDAEAGNGFGEQHFEGTKGRQKREKLIGIAKTERNKQAIEQLEAIDLQRIENPAWSLEDLEKADSRGELNQLTDLEKAKVYASFQRVEEPTGEEVVSIVSQMDQLRKAKKTLPQDDYIKLYHSLNLQIRGRLPSKGSKYTWIFTDLASLNPFSEEGRTGSKELKTRYRGEVMKLANENLKMGNYDTRPDKGGRKEKDRYGNSEYDYSNLEPSQAHEQGMRMRDMIEDMNEYIDSSDQPLTLEDIRTKFGILMSGGKITAELERQQTTAQFPFLPPRWNHQRTENNNTWAEKYSEEDLNQSPAIMQPKQTGEFKKGKKVKLPTTTGSVDRSPVVNEVDSSQDTRRLLFASAYAEVGSQGDEAIQGYMETVTNRALATGKSLRSVLLDSKYYPPETKKKLSNPNPPDYSDQWMLVSNGSNITNYATDNASAGVARKRKNAGNPYIDLGGETFYVNINGSGRGGIPAHAQWLKRNSKL